MDVSLATSHSMLVLIRITIPIQEFLTEYFLPFQSSSDNSKNLYFAALALLACALRVPLLSYKSAIILTIQCEYNARNVAMPSDN